MFYKTNKPCLFPVAAMVYIITTYSNFSVCLGRTLIEKGNEPHNLVYLGQASSVGYHAEQNETMNWKDADTFCKSSGMNLAVVRTVAQVTLLRSQLGTRYPGRGFWVAAREDQTATGFVWTESTTDNPVTGAVTWNTSGPDYANCVIVHAKQALSYSVKSCSDTNWLVLCMATQKNL